MQANPILVNVIRKDIVESTHTGSVLVVNGQGETIFALGNTDRNIYPRSAIKFFQAISLVESGAADHFAMSDSEIALACASHNAEPFHVDAVTSWLNRLGLTIDDLECGPTLPIGETAAHELIAKGTSPTRAHQNCSGKHSGMLTLTRFLGQDIKGYSKHQHLSQQTWMQIFGELVDLDISALPWERDGCGLPAICMPMDKLAFGFAQFANLHQIEKQRAEAMQRIIHAVQKHPEMIAGSDRCCTHVIAATKGEVLVKTGAEGVYGGFIPKRGIGFVLKNDDGATRGSEVALGALLNHMGVISKEANAALKPWFRPSILNSQNWQTGYLEPAEIWSQ